MLMIDPGSVFAITRSTPFFFLGAAKYFKKFGIFTKYPYINNNLFIKKYSLGINSIFSKEDSKNKEMSLHEMLAQDDFRNIIDKVGKDSPIFILVSKATSDLLAICKQNNWNLIGPSPDIIQKLDSKSYFRSLLKKMKLPSIPSLTISGNELLKISYQKINEQIGKKFVIQDHLGKTGEKTKTMFISTQGEFLDSQQLIQKNKLNDSSFIISKYISGIPLSMLGCSTSKGTLTGFLQFQIIDSIDVANTNNAKGVFCGHDWGKAQEFKIVEAAMASTVKTIGDYIYTLGYRGLFGIDFIFDSQNCIALALECNPRYTGSFPLFSLIEEMNNSIPLEFFHLVENTSQTYSSKLINAHHSTNVFSFSHLVLKNKFEEDIVSDKDIPSGVYRIDNSNNLQFIKSNCGLNELSPNTFLLINATHNYRSPIAPNKNIAKIIFPISIVNKDNELIPQVKNICNSFYSNFR